MISVPTATCLPIEGVNLAPMELTRNHLILKNNTAKIKIPVRIQGTALNISAVHGACLPQSKICFELAQQ